MKRSKLLLAIALVVLLGAHSGWAADFGWIDDFNVRAEADPAGLRARLEARFRIGDMEVGVVLDNVDNPAHAYIVFRLGEIANRPVAQVLERYKADKHRGWGALAQSLGIKPGSPEFHDLKQGQDLFDDLDHGTGKGQGRDKPKKNK